ncbi:glycoside hydrolase [Microbacterium sp. CFBP9034]|uniref:glycoside hydrolase n=1 Tax=Microbacterium sp. CFBP9034 TaxID=3096540 RepID=UPI002A6A67E8|nr:glycoside hydrolase [Microbacterium sp. CFBP9034]MDY0908478.1 glycoside hydrolase [Microbacterium sp. CFBP9034]
MKSISRALTAAAAFALVGSSLAAVPTAAQAAGVPVRITPNPAYASAPFEGWGTSLVWFANATGGYPEGVRQDLFDKVFGDDGLNLNIARYNIGGGNATDVPSYLRPGGAVEGWWNPELGVSDAEGAITSEYADRERYAAAWNGDDPAHYDFDADATQRWWIDALKDKVTKWEAFSNSPPYFLTQSGYVSGGIDNGSTEQLAAEDMADFADYLVTVVDRLEAEHGIEFDTLDPFNEPNTSYWSTRIGTNGWPTSASRQEGAHIGPQRQDLMVKALESRLTEPGTATDVAISAMDETNPSIFSQNWNAWTPESKGIVDQLNVHTYGTGDRLVVRDIAKAADKPLWMSEVEGDWDGTGFNLTNIENGLGMAGRIVDDLRELEPSAWVFWQPVEDLYNMEKVEDLNWGSVFIDFDCDANGNSLRRIADGEADPSCQVQTNAKYNTVRNFTHYIRPGDSLIPTDNAQTTAAVTAEGDGVTLVHVNTEAVARDITIDLSGFAQIAPGATVTPIVTTQSPTDDVTANALVEGAAVPVDGASRTAVVSVPGKSVTTLLVEGVSGASAQAPALEDGETYQLFGVQSGKALTADPAGLAIRTGGTTSATATPQAWTVHSLSGAGTDRQRVALENGDGRLLAVSGTSTALVDADPSAAASDPALQWIPSTTDGKTFSLLSVAAERVLDVNGQSSVDGAGVGTWTSNNGGNQRWTIAGTGIREVKTVEAATRVGVAPALPSQVTVVYDGGVERSASVVWDTAGADWSTAGTVTVAGSGTDAFGASFEAEARVVIGAFAATDPVSITTFAGAGLARVQASAPASVPGQVGAAPQRFPLGVTWDWEGLTDTSFAAPGVVTVPGTASDGSGGAGIPATLSIIVTAAGEGNVAPQSTATATFTESASYGVDRTKNGLRTDKGWSNWRSGTKNVQDTLTYDLAKRERVQHVTAYFFKDGSSNSWPQSMRVEHRTGTGAWTASGSVAVPVPADGTAPVVDIPLGGVEADDVRVVLDARAATHMIVSEIEIYASAATRSSVADLARVTLDGADLDGFESGKTAYTVPWTSDAAATVAAVPVDDDAVIEIAQPTGPEGEASVTVTAPDGTERVYTLDFVRETAPALDVSATATTRCVAGKVVVALSVANADDQPVRFVASSSYGKATIGPVAAGKKASAVFTTRTVGVPAGEISIVATAPAAPELSETIVAAYGAASCG